MKTVRKIYYVPGLFEYRMRVRRGGVTFVIDFTGGRKEGDRTRWGRYVATNPVVMRILEESQEFRKGVIKSL